MSATATAPMSARARRKAIGADRAHCASLIGQLRDFISAAYKAVNDGPYNADDPRHVLRDYARNVGWSDAFAQLVETEQADERGHLKYKPASIPRGLSVPHAADLLIVHWAGQGDAAGRVAAGHRLAGAASRRGRGRDPWLPHPRPRHARMGRGGPRA